ncbi:unnamed protein product [Linum trigynum]|uniref:NPH3 domain-containing protein n=1 Tax=Linum trigynum TaxID=586398 RepID=A0AAV2FHI6_9ROSI
MEARREELQVDVNGDEVFILDKSIMESFSRISPKLSRLFSNTNRQKSNQLKVIFDEFPGGAEGFELVTRFCYRNGKFPITPSNFVLLHCATQFLEIDIDGSEKYVEEISYWTWSELVSGLKQCQLDSVSNSRFSSFILRKVMESIVSRISLPVVTSSSTSSSSDGSTSSSSTATSFRSYYSSRNWWFEDLMFLKPDMLVKLVRLMVAEKLDHWVIFRFVVFHLKSNVGSTSSSSVAVNIIEAAIDTFSMLERSALSCKGLFDILRVVSNSRAKIKSCQRVKLETLIGLRLDGATLDQLMLVPHQGRKRNKHHVYDVNLTTRLVKAFLIEGWVSPTRLKKVVNLFDNYIREVAPDIRLKTNKFFALLTILPDSGRESSDVLYQAIDMYLEGHVEVCGKDERMRICSALNRGKLSGEALRQLAHNPRFPSMAAVNAFMAQQSKLSCSNGMSRSCHYSRSKSTTFEAMTTKKAEDKSI